jgi:hypothetical protein
LQEHAIQIARRAGAVKGPTTNIPRAGNKTPEICASIAAAGRNPR